MKRSERIAIFSLLFGVAVFCLCLYLGLWWWLAALVGLLVAGPVYSECLKLAAAETMTDRW